MANLTWARDGALTVASRILNARSDLGCSPLQPDGTRIATAVDDKTARIWDAANG
jgi:WD40 repeat protein